jgi:hypothetical protein
MHKINEAAIPVVAAETRAILAATDKALLAHAQMLAAVVEGAQQSDVPISVTQELYARIMAHGSKIIEGRDDLRQLITRLTAIKNLSDQREVALGCPAGAPEVIGTIFAQVRSTPTSTAA